MIRAKEVADFIRAQISTSGWTPNTSNAAHKLKVVPDAVIAQGEIIPSPDRLVAVVVSGGGPTLGERTRDQATVQVFTRGLQRSDADAENVAASADNVLMGVVPQIVLGNTRVMSIDYQGGPPAFLRRDDAKRALFICNYLFQTARDVT
jgi:hypothetical protein